MTYLLSSYSVTLQVIIFLLEQTVKCIKVQFIWNPHAPANWTTIISKVEVASKSKFGALHLLIHNSWKYCEDIHE